MLCFECVYILIWWERPRYVFRYSWLRLIQCISFNASVLCFNGYLRVSPDVLQFLQSLVKA